jgi:hypothetical protein
MNPLEKGVAAMRAVSYAISSFLLFACSGLDEDSSARSSEYWRVAKYIEDGTKFCTPTAILVPGVGPDQAEKLCRCINQAAVNGIDAHDLSDLKITHVDVRRRMMESVDAAGARCRSEAGVSQQKPR